MYVNFHSNLIIEIIYELSYLFFRALSNFQSDWKREFGSLGSNEIDSDRLSCGAQIRRIFHRL